MKFIQQLFFNPIQFYKEVISAYQRYTKKYELARGLEEPVEAYVDRMYQAFMEAGGLDVITGRNGGELLLALFNLVKALGDYSVRRMKEVDTQP